MMSLSVESSDMSCKRTSKSSRRGRKISFAVGEMIFIVLYDMRSGSVDSWVDWSACCLLSGLLSRRKHVCV